MSNDMKKYMRLMEASGEASSGCNFIIDEVNMSNAQKEAYVVVSFENCDKMKDSKYEVDDIEYQLENMTVEIEFKIEEEEIEIPGSTSRMLSPRYRSVKAISKVERLDLTDVYMVDEEGNELVDVDSLNSDIKQNLTNAIESDQKLMDRLIKEVEDQF